MSYLTALNKALAYLNLLEIEVISCRKNVAYNDDPTQTVALLDELKKANKQYETASLMYDIFAGVE